jgi:hypothetical protein
MIHKEEQLKKTIALGLGLMIALVGLLQTSCAKKGDDRTFLKLYTSCNMMGGLEPCG